MTSAEPPLRSQVLGVDFGESRVGVALSDDEQRHCMPLTTILRNSDAQVIDDLLELVSQHEVTELIVGEPKNVDGSRGPAARRARSFARKLSRRSAAPVTLVDEALTTVEATQRLREAGLSGPALRDRVDAVAAQVLLEGALNQRRQARKGREQQDRERVYQEQGHQEQGDQEQRNQVSRGRERCGDGS